MGSSILAALGGLSGGFSDQFAKIQEENRKTKVAQDKLVSEALFKQAQENPNLTPDQQDDLFREGYRRIGVKPHDIETIVRGLHTHFRNQLGDGTDQAPQTQAQSQGSPQPSAGGGDIDLGYGLPAMPKSPGAGGGQAGVAGPVPSVPKSILGAFTPPFPNPATVGEYNANRAAQVEYNKASNETARQMAIENEKEKARLERESEMADKKFSMFLKARDEATKSGQHVKTEYINGEPRIVPDQGSFRGTVYGGAIQDWNQKETKDPEMLYRRTEFSGDGTVRYDPVSKAVTTVTNDPSSPTGAWKNVFDQSGTLISRLPVNPSLGLVPTRTTTVQTPEGQISTKEPLIPKGQTPGMPGQPIPKPSFTNAKATGFPKPFDDTDKVDHIIASIGRDAANEKLLSNLDKGEKNKAMQRMADLGIDPGNVSASTRDAATRAKTVLPEYPIAYSMIDSLEKKGKLGPGAGRLNDFLVGTVGADDPEFNSLRGQIKLIGSNLAYVHGGARGGGSVEMTKRFDSLFGTDRMTAGNLKAALKTAERWVRGYAAMIPDTDKTTGKPITPSSDLPRPPLSSFQR